MANEKRTCNQMCRWNDSSDGCIKPESMPCPMSNTEPDASGWGQVKVANESTCHITSKRRLIDANALLAELDKFVNPMPDAYGLHFLNGLSTAITEIEDAPTVDAVEVVRCKDCRDCMMCYPEKQLDKEATQAWLCDRYKEWKKPDDFCSYGERRGGRKG